MWRIEIMRLEQTPDPHVMETREWHFRDKSAWGEGPWQHEPDKMQWPDRETGLPCLIVRNPDGALCGYVGVSESHPHFGKDYSNVDADVHGGLTFADRCSGEEHGICHVVQGEDPPTWWFGFDCAHFCDILPDSRVYRVGDEHVYRDVAYVQEECRKLALQLKALEE
jgi:hypothetical protein